VWGIVGSWLLRGSAPLPPAARRSFGFVGSVGAVFRGFLALVVCLGGLRAALFAARVMIGRWAPARSAPFLTSAMARVVLGNQSQDA